MFGRLIIFEMGIIGIKSMALRSVCNGRVCGWLQGGGDGKL